MRLDQRSATPPSEHCPITRILRLRLAQGREAFSDQCQFVGKKNRISLGLSNRDHGPSLTLQ